MIFITRRFFSSSFVVSTSSLTALTVSLLIGVLSACTPQDEQAVDTRSEETFRWKMVTTWPANFPVFQDGVDRFVKYVETMSGGRMQIMTYPANTLIPPLEVFEAVKLGSVEMGHGAAYYWAGKIPAAQFMTTVPFGMTVDGMNAWLYGGDGLRLWHELYAPHNLVAFPMGNTSVQMGGWFNKKINSIADLDGLRMRIPGLGAKVLAKAGGNPVLMAGGEVYTALDRKTIDATEWVGPFHDLRMGLNNAAKYYYYPGWHEPGSAFELLINKEKWERLPADLQEIIQVAAEANNLRVQADFDVFNQRALTELKNDLNGVEILPFPKDVMQSFQRLTAEMLDEYSAKDPVFKKIHENYRAFMIENRAWKALSDSAYHAIVQEKTETD